jgi:hypothetical protein
MRCPLSANSIARLKEKWWRDDQAWAAYTLSDLEPVDMWVDGVYVKAAKSSSFRR